MSDSILLEIIEKDWNVDCCNGQCNWAGNASECVAPKHEPEYLLCPECYEVVEPLSGSENS